MYGDPGGAISGSGEGDGSGRSFLKPEGPIGPTKGAGSRAVEDGGCWGASWAAISMGSDGLVPFFF